MDTKSAKKYTGKPCRVGSILPENINTSVDVAIFAGQSNMSGRGAARDVAICGINAGFEYKSVSVPHTLTPLKEPFGLGEDRLGGIYDLRADGTSKRTGSIVSALVNEYHKSTGRQLIAVSASVGGICTDEWRRKFIFDAVKRLDDTLSFLKENNIGTGRIFVVWCQGETDGDNNVDGDTYIKNTKELFDAFKVHGAEHFFLIQIGHFNYIMHPDKKHIDLQYETIRAAQEKLCADNDDITLTASFEGFISEMKDSYHYLQCAYNKVGNAAGKRIAEYYTRKSRILCKVLTIASKWYIINNTK